MESDRRRRSPIIEGLRNAGDEFQLTRVLAGVCSSAPEVSKAFVDAVIRLAATDAHIGARAKQLRLPKSISCTREHGLARIGRQSVAKQRRTLGTPDLTFTAANHPFHLICELKIDARYRKDQIKDYLETEAYVVSIVRKPRTMPREVAEHDRWLGEVAWRDLAEELRNLPLAEPDRQIWLDLVDVLESDGDFEQVPPKRATEDDLKLVEAVADDVLAKLRRAIRKRPQGEALAQELRIGRMTVGNRVALAEIEYPPRELLIALTVRNARLRTPSIAVEWYPAAGREVERQQRDMHERLTAIHHFRKRSGRGGYFRFREDLTTGHDDLQAVATKTAWRAVEAIVSVGLLDRDIRDVARG